MGEKTISLILKDFGIEFVTNYNIYIYGLLNGEYPKLIDFYIPYYNLLIEYNGQQHYEPVRFGGISMKKAKENLEKQLIRDQDVREFAIINNIKLLEINANDFNYKILHSELEFKIYYELSGIEEYEHSMGRRLGYPPEEYPTYEELFRVMEWSLNE